MNKDKNIILIGMMGCGKSTVGHLLDEKIPDFQYVDLDKEIEKEAKKTIPEIFAQDGEAYFRELESKTVQRFCNYRNQVISTGGGAVEKPENRAIMKENGTIFYLKADVKTLFDRVKKTSNRPMLFRENPMEAMKTLLAKREEFYKEADFTIETEKKELLEIVEEIVNEYEKRLHKD